MQPLLDVGGGWQELRISPDGRRLAFQGDAAIMRVRVYDIERSALSRLPFDGESGQPIWTPDSRHVAFWGGDGQSGAFGTFLQLADGSQPAERLTNSFATGLRGFAVWRPRSFSPDGNVLALETMRPETGWDTYLLHMAGERTPEPFMTTRFNEYHAAFSPDGLWVAYQSDESGRPEVYLRPFPGPMRRWQASTQGGTKPVWSPKGDELFYRNEDQMMVIDVEAEATLTLGKPRVLFKRRPADLNRVHRDFDISRDGRRFAVIDSSNAMRRPTELVLVQHWGEELKRLVPPD